MNAYVLSEDAALDLDDIWEYIAQDNTDAADRWIGKLFDAFEAVGRSPGIGHKREDLTGYPVLFFPVDALGSARWRERRPQPPVSAQSECFRAIQWGRLATCGPIVNRSIRAQPGHARSRDPAIMPRRWPCHMLDLAD